jgi:uncharacterized protein involved in outer membrane biogenesis
VTIRRIAIYGFGLIGALIAIGAAALFALGPFDLAPIVVRHLSASPGRTLSIATLRVRVGAAVSLELRDLDLDNLPNGSVPRMLHITRLDAEIAPWSVLLWGLWHRALVVRHLSVDGVRLWLEHGSDDRPNWRFGDSVTRPSTRRTQFPVLLDAKLHDVEIDLRTSSGKILRVTLDDAGIAARGAGRPVTLNGSGGYNAIPIQFAATTRSFNELHNTAVPFGMALHFASGDTTMDFIGTMTDPTNADGADGRLTVNAPTWDRMLAIAGVQDQIALPVTLAGTVTREGDLWRLTGANGTLHGHPFQGNARLREGARHAPDDISLDAAFSVLDLTGLPAPGESGETTIRIDAEPGTLVDAHVTADQLLYGDVRAGDVDLKAKLAPGALAIEPLTLRLAGGDARIDAAVENTKTSSAMRFDAALTGAGIGQLSEVFGIGKLPLTGAVDARAHLRLTGNTLTEAERSNRGVVILSMGGGSIERKITEGASTDLRMLFRPAEGSGQIACLLGILDVRDGIGRIAPLRIMTSDGTIAGTGTLNLRDKTINVVVASESASTSLFALDIPMRISGPILSPRVVPALGSAGGRENTVADQRDMPPELQEFIRGSRCLKGGGR